MSISQEKNRHVISRMYYLSFFAFLAIALLFASCRTTKRLLINKLGDTPIIISGGSIQLDLNKNAFDNPTPTEYKTKMDDGGEHLYRGYIYDNNPSPISDIDLSANNQFKGDVTITLEHYDGSVYKTMVTITSHYADPMSVSIKLEQESTFRGRGKLVWNLFDSTHRIDKVTVKRNSETPVVYKPMPTGSEKALPANGKLTMELYAE